MSTLVYHNSGNPVRAGDRILVRRLFRRPQLGLVVYIPGQVEFNSELGDDQWAYKSDDGIIWAAGYFPDQYPQISKKISFVSRPGQEADEVIKAYRIPPEESPTEHRSDFLALLGCATLVTVVAILGVALWKWFIGR